MITHFLIFPLLVWGAIAIAGALTVAGLAGAFSSEEVAKVVKEDPNIKKIAILGMEAAGKTRFLSFLRNVPFIEGTTNRKDYTSFIYKLSSGKEITINEGVDIGGGDIYRSDYNLKIEKNDVILYLFNIDSYMKNILDPDGQYYQRSCNSRFEHIYSKSKELKKYVLIIATHRDKCKLNDIVLKKEFDTLMGNKPYKEMLNDLLLVDLTNDVEVKELVDTIFKN